MSESAVFDISKVYVAVLENGHSKAAAPSKSLITIKNSKYGATGTTKNIFAYRAAAASAGGRVKTAEEEVSTTLS